MRRLTRILAAQLVACLTAGAAGAQGEAEHGGVGDLPNSAFTRDFLLERCTFASHGSNPYFILEPGYRLVLEGEEDGEELVVVITVTNQTETIGNVRTRVVVERETIDGELVEISRNWFAICRETNSVVYFGEHVDIYEDGEIVSHEGSWRVGRGGARPGLIMPGTLLLGGRYFQEIAFGVAMDRAEIASLSETVRTPIGRFERCLKTVETTPLEPGDVSVKLYCPDVGLVRDGPAKLVRAFYVNGS